MIEDKETINYELEITTPSKIMCARVDPFGLCTPTDCMTCKYSKVKITREDGIIMRNDWSNTHTVNSGYERKYSEMIYEYKENPIAFLEQFFGMSFTKWQKIFLNTLIRTQMNE